MDIRINKKPMKLTAPSLDDLLNLIEDYKDASYDFVCFNYKKIRARKERQGKSYHVITKKRYEANVYTFKLDFLDNQNIEIHQFKDYFRIVYDGVIPKNYPKNNIKLDKHSSIQTIYRNKFTKEIAHIENKNRWIR